MAEIVLDKVTKEYPDGAKAVRDGQRHLIGRRRYSPGVVSRASRQDIVDIGEQARAGRRCNAAAGGTRRCAERESFSRRGGVGVRYVQAKDGSRSVTILNR
jgi:hypothetical protein